MKTLATYTFLIISLALFSCNKQLNALPDEAKVDGNAITDQQSANIAMNGVYYQLAAVEDYSDIMMAHYEEYHEIVGAFLAGTLYSDFSSGLSDNVPDYSGWILTGLWTNSYRIINAANGVIKGVEALPDSKFVNGRKNELLGEAKFLRAYASYTLLSYFGQFFDPTSAYGILIRKDFVTPDNIEQARSTVQESYDFILEDVDFAIANAPASNPVQYATRWTAKALKARILLNRGSGDDYDQVIALTKDVIENGPYQLEANLKDIFSTKGPSSSEVMLAIFPTPNQRIKSDDYFGYPEWTATDQLKEYLQGDPRDSWVAQNGISPYYGDESYDVWKYTGNYYEYSYVFRLTEEYLFQAEAIVRANKDLNDAKALLKTVMSHAGVTDFTAVDNANTPDELLMQIFYETTKNLCFEDGQEWFSMLRLPLETVKMLRPSINDKIQFILPVPKTEFQLNPGFGNQNPGYSK